MTRKSNPFQTDPPAPEFSRPLELGTLPATGLVREIEAEPAERDALARRFGLVAIGALNARLRVAPIKSGGASGARVSGGFSGRVTQICVVSLEPFETEVVERVELDLLPAPAIETVGDPDLYHDDEVEPLEGDVLDLGELVAQYLSLALDPYPRRPGVRFEPADAASAEAGDAARSGPFAVLGDLKRKM